MRKIKSLLALTLIMMLVIGVIPVQAATVKMSKSKATIEVGKTLTLTLKNATDGTIKWTSSNKSVATVKSSGTNKAKVTAIGEGTATIKAKYDGETYKCKVTVQYPTIDWTVTFGEWNTDNETVSWHEKDGEYSGNLVKGVPNGYGKFETENSAGVEYYYTGSFVDGQPNGLGVCVWDNGTGQFEYGNYKNGLYNPTFGQFIYSAGPWYMQYVYGAMEISLDCCRFIDECAGLSKKEVKSQAETVELRKIKKNVVNYNDCISVVEDAYVVQCFEDNCFGHAVSYFLAYTDEGYYILIYDGVADIYEGDYIDFYATPLYNASFDNISGGTTLATYEAAYIIENAE